MSRYNGPTNRISRRLGISILETGKEFSKGKRRTTKPGQHGKSRKKQSIYGNQLLEKQKIRFLYGVSEKQLSNYAKKAQNMKDSSAMNLLILLESRLDNLVYRMGIATTRRSARQLVSHGHILLNSKKNNIASTQVKVNSNIEVKDKSKKLKSITESLKNYEGTLSFVRFDKNKLIGEYLRVPLRSEISQDFKEALVIEFYNR